MDGDRCPRCGAATRADAPWCTLCYTPRTSTPRSGSPPGGSEPPAPPAAPQRPVVLVAAPGWPCRECGQRNDWAAEVCAGCGAAFLEPLADQPGAGVAGLGSLLAMPRAGRLGLAGVAAVLGVAVLLMAATVASWLLS